MTIRGTRSSSKLAIIFVVLSLSLLFAAVAQAQAGGPVVTNLNDSGAGSLRQAVIDAPAGSEITFQSGLSGTISLASTIVIDKNLTITGSGKGVITVSGSFTNGVFEVLAGNNVTISCLTIRNGNDTTGAGVLNRGSLTVSGVEFGNNTALGAGGALYNDVGATMTVERSKFYANSANMGGGAIFNNGTLTVEDSLFKNNGSSTIGGAIANAENNASVSSSHFYGNLAQSGGAIYSQAPMTITGSNISGNTGAIDGGALRVTNSTTNISSSCIMGSTTPDTAFDAEESTGTLIANGNWWGKATGPNTPGADTTNATVTSFLTQKPAACQEKDDGRANKGHGDDYAIIYPALDDIGDPALHIYCVSEEGEGYLGMIVTQEMVDEYPEEPEENVKVEDTDACRVYVSFYLLVTGEYQVNIGPKINGDVAVAIFTGMPPTNIYYRDFNIYDIEWPIEVPPAESPVTVTPEPETEE
ncbi:MAG: hypothetical protein JXB30_01790 [Anaerolineae bacterium]|nr:hypothetical protein [Anaerolineae bacterium]